jgi:hypothetical protein
MICRFLKKGVIVDFHSSGGQDKFAGLYLFSDFSIATVTESTLTARFSTFMLATCVQVDINVAVSFRICLYL